MGRVWEHRLRNATAFERYGLMNSELSDAMHMPRTTGHGGVRAAPWALGVACRRGKSSATVLQGFQAPVTQYDKQHTEGDTSHSGSTYATNPLRKDDRTLGCLETPATDTSIKTPAAQEDLQMEATMLRCVCVDSLDPYTNPCR